MAQTSRSSPAIGGAVPTQCKYALNWTRLSCHRFMANRVRLSLFVLAYNLGNFLRRLCLPKAVKHWSLRSVQVKLIKMGGRLVRHSRRLIFQLSEVSVPRRLFQGVLDRIGRLSPAKLRESTTTILPRGGECSRESLYLQCGFTPLAGDTRTMKTDKKGALRLQTHLLLDRPAIDWPCRT